MSTGPTLPDGYTDVPAGKIASVVTYLEMRERPARARGPEKPELSVERIGPADTARYKEVYRAIGERWFWFSRLAIPDAALAQFLSNPRVEAYAAVREGRDIGLMEIDFRGKGEAEIVYFGLVDRAVGQGAGRWLMDQALAVAWARPIRRCWLHTCTLDHPGAVGFYRRSGFTPYKLAIEVADDPRLTGALSPDAFPDIPLAKP
ncbi:GNAT family N-acetyltransferase [Alsobacter soli]|uniref:GNAT family N-acetyltransferase n=1 Tax=Alsobacter soli TaxID=2109933 RepID=A0A2T1HZA7_9HYPH|nr:GNAT family N-acetyltransferase [Alsobacter soli]PSC06920.1 GNAT family N-acetyltransferase [Alsobacter soli]